MVLWNCFGASLGRTWLAAENALALNEKRPWEGPKRVTEKPELSSESRPGQTPGDEGAHPMC